MHYTGTVWRPPYEAESLLLEVTAGCSHHQCKFCTLYDDLPFRFRITPMQTIQDDLQEAQLCVSDPMTKLSAKLQGLPDPGGVQRVFLVGANPFVLSFQRLHDIALQIRHYLPSCRTIGCFARVTDVARKSDAELLALRALGFDGLSIGAETGHDASLKFMKKGYTAQDIVRQAQRLDHAQITYYFTYLAGLPGKGRCAEAAAESAAVFQQTHPKLIGSSMLTVYPNSALYQDKITGNWTEASETEKLQELSVLVQRLDISVYFATLGASNAVQVQGRLPDDRDTLLAQLDSAASPENESSLRLYRANLKHL